MKTLESIISEGNEDILNGNTESLAAIAFMAFHAGISKGENNARENIRNKLKYLFEEVSKHRYNKLICKYMPEIPKEIVLPEYKEILSFEYRY